MRHWLLVSELRSQLLSQDRIRPTRQRFEQRHQLADESVASYAVNISKLSETALSIRTVPTERDQVRRDRFITGLLPQNKGQVIVMTPSTFQEALIAAERVELSQPKGLAPVVAATAAPPASPAAATASNSAITVGKVDEISKSIQQLTNVLLTQPAGNDRSSAAFPNKSLVQRESANVEQAGTPRWAKGLVNTVQSLSDATFRPTANMTNIEASNGPGSTMREPQRFTTNR